MCLAPVPAIAMPSINSSCRSVCAGAAISRVLRFAYRLGGFWYCQLGDCGQSSERLDGEGGCNRAVVNSPHSSRTGTDRAMSHSRGEPWCVAYGSLYLPQPV